ncbi:hypothetical protein OTU49_016686, partial [Cherax quadricarinatus]
REALRESTGVTLMAPTQDICCALRRRQSLCDCDTLLISRELTMNAMLMLTKVLKADARQNVRGTCGEAPSNPPSTTSFYPALQTEMSKWEKVEWQAEKLQIVPQLEFDITAFNSNSTLAVGSWSTSQQLKLNPRYQNSPIKRHFRIGTIMVKCLGFLTSLKR